MNPAFIAHQIAARLCRPPFAVSRSLYDRACRGMVAAVGRRAGGIQGLGVDDDRDARWWRAWDLAAARQYYHASRGPISSLPARPNPKTARWDWVKLGLKSSEIAVQRVSLAVQRPISPKGGPDPRPGRIARQRQNRPADT